MSTTYLPNQLAANRFAMSQATANFYHKNLIDSMPTSHEGEEKKSQLMLGIFYFYVPTFFFTTAFGLNYLLKHDLTDYGWLLGGVALVTRIVSSYFMKGMAADKNRNKYFWISFAMIVPAIAMICLSLVRKKHS